MPRIDSIQFRRGTAAQWATANPVLLGGELGFETDTRLFKIGDGVTAWSSLLYAADVGGSAAAAISAHLAAADPHPQYTTLAELAAYAQPLAANLTAMAGLASAADRLPYFTGAGTAAVTVFSSFSRDLLDDADAATWRATLAVAGTGVENTFAVGQIVTGGTFSGGTATNPGVRFVWSSGSVGTAHIGMQGSSWNALGIWGAGQPTNGNPTMSFLGSTTNVSGSFTHLAGAFTFNCRNDIAAGNPGFTIQSFGAAMAGINIQAPASFTGQHQKLSGVTTGAGASNQNQAAIVGGWGVSTHNSQTGYIEFGVYNQTTYQAGLRITASASGPVYSFGGTFPYLPSTATVTEVAGTSFSVGSSDSGKVYRTTSGSAVTCTLSGTAAEGTQITVSQKGSGQVTFTVSGSGSLVPPFGTADNKTAGTNAMVTLIVDQNVGGSAAEWKLAGETAA